MNYEKLLNLREGDVLDGANETLSQVSEIVITSCGVTVKNITIDACLRIEADDVCLINVMAREIYVRGSGFIADKCELGDIYLDNCTNALISQGASNLIRVSNTFNFVCVLNTAKNIECKNNVNINVVDNSISEKLCIHDCNYVIADGNTCGEICVDANENVNGNNVTDVDFRPEFGANEDILPHTNKELFVGMPRRKTVANTTLSAAEYISEQAKASDVIILPPAAYEAWDGIQLYGDAFRNKTIYGYGAYYEYADAIYTNYPPALIRAFESGNIRVLGISLGYKVPSSGQVRVVEKINEGDKYAVRVIADAGFMDGLGKSDLSRYMSWWVDVFLNDEKTGKAKLYCSEAPKGAYEIEQSLDDNGNYDGTLIITLKGRGDNPHSEGKSAKQLWDLMDKGNIITCRLVQTGKCSVDVCWSSDVFMRDVVLYGFSGGIAVVAGGQCDNVKFERFHNAVHSATLIDKETYDKYRSLEEKWGVSFDVHVDENGRYRGPVSRSGSMDGFHTVSCTRGVDVVSSIVESMVDDANNQHGYSARLHGYKDNGDGTTTFIYKPFITPVSWGFCCNKPDPEVIGTSNCSGFSAGHRAYIYNPYGQPVCDAPVLYNGIATGEKIDINLTYDGVRKHAVRDLYAITVKTQDVDFSALVDYKTGKEFDLLDNGLEMTNRVTVDNINSNSSGYTLDNVLALNVRTRGFLIKAADVNIKHCTIRNVSGSGLLIRSESEWAESTIARNVNIQQCLFDNIGYMFTATQNPERAHIRIEATSTVASDKTLPIDNITIDRCKFTNNEQKYAIMINSAKNIHVKGNVFDPIVNECDRTRGVAVLMKTCMNIEISDNTYNYPHYNGDARNVVEGSNYLNVYGTDVTDKDGRPLIPDSISE